jgi:integrase
VRQGEILSLQWADIDFEPKLISITAPEVCDEDGKISEVPMSETVFELRLRRELTGSVSPFVFHQKGLKRPRGYGQYKFKESARKLGLSQNVRFQSRRYTFATWLVQERVSIYYEVQKLLGHSDISVTQVYSRLAASDLHGAVKRISVSQN